MSWECELAQSQEPVRPDNSLQKEVSQTLSPAALREKYGLHPDASNDQVLNTELKQLHGLEAVSEDLLNAIGEPSKVTVTKPTIEVTTLSQYKEHHHISSDVSDVSILQGIDDRVALEQETLEQAIKITSRTVE
jgi:hypothetical protein